MEAYFFEQNGKQVGPFTFEEIKTKRLLKTTLVWKEGLPDWTEAQKLPEINNILITKPPPLPKKNITPPEIETIQIKKAPSPATSTKYDLTYKKETDATFFGVLLLVVLIILNLTGAITFETVESYNQSRAFIAIGSLVLRIAITIWVVNIASRQNRNSTSWGWFAFFLPSIALIIIGTLRKLKVEEVQNSYNSGISKIKDKQKDKLEINIDKLRENAESLFKEGRYYEVLDVCELILEENPNKIFALKFSAVCHYKLFDTENAKKYCDKLLESGYKVGSNDIIGEMFF